MQRVGYVLLVIGLLALTIFGFYEFAVSKEDSTLVKAVVTLFMLGLAVLFLTVLRQRLHERKTDKYDDVKL